MAKAATKTTTNNVSNLAAVIDSDGELKALMAELAIKKKTLEDQMSDLAPGAYEGNLFRISISQYDRETPDAELKAQIDEVVEEFKSTLSRQYLKAHTQVTPCRTHKPTARSGKGVTA